MPNQSNTTSKRDTADRKTDAYDYATYKARTMTEAQLRKNLSYNNEQGKIHSDAGNIRKANQHRRRALAYFDYIDRLHAIPDSLTVQSLDDVIATNPYGFGRS